MSSMIFLFLNRVKRLTGTTSNSKAKGSKGSMATWDASSMVTTSFVNSRL